MVEDIGAGPGVVPALVDTHNSVTSWYIGPISWDWLLAVCEGDEGTWV